MHLAKRIVLVTIVAVYVLVVARTLMVEWIDYEDPGFQRIWKHILFCLVAMVLVLLSYRDVLDRSWVLWIGILYCVLGAMGLILDDSEWLVHFLSSLFILFFGLLHLWLWRQLPPVVADE